MSIPPPNPSIETAVRILNEAFVADPAAIHSLLCNRVPCNQTLADHPSVVVDVAEHVGSQAFATVGLVGLLNGVLEPQEKTDIPYELRAKQVVVGRKVGNQVYYTLRDPVLIPVLDLLKLLGEGYGPKLSAALFRTPNQVQTHLRVFLNDGEACVTDDVTGPDAAAKVNLMVLPAFEGGG